MLRTRFIAAATAALLLAANAYAADDLGARLYFNHCAACHGQDGEGGGPVATTLNIAPPNLRSLARRNGGVFPAVDVTAYIDGRQTAAAHGERQMPIWGDVFRGPEQGTAERTTRRRIAALVDFIESLQYP
jgi:mono/diheme cytochrome c family protein